jgi:hypothetical protein
MLDLEIRGWRPLCAAALTVVSSCAGTGFQRSSFELIVEGNEASYPAFEAAARNCGYIAFERFPGASVGGTNVPPHFNLSKVRSPAALCTTRWVDEHPEADLQISGH